MKQKIQRNSKRNTYIHYKSLYFWKLCCATSLLDFGFACREERGETTGRFSVEPTSRLAQLTLVWSGSRPASSLTSRRLMFLTQRSITVRTYIVAWLFHDLQQLFPVLFIHDGWYVTLSSSSPNFTKILLFQVYSRQTLTLLPILAWKEYERIRFSQTDSIIKEWLVRNKAHEYTVGAGGIRAYITVPVPVRARVGICGCVTFLFRRVPRLV